MSRRSTAGSAGVVFHVVTRATCGQLLFRTHGEYLAFHYLLARALTERPIRLLAYCLMPNHQHLVLWPATEGEMAAFLRWLLATHARLLHRCRGTDGRGAIYASRYRAAAIDTETYFYRAMRYVERNPVRARLTDRAEFWPWSSASPVSRLHGIALASWPLPRPSDWLAYVNDVEPGPDLDFIRVRTNKRKPIRPTEPDRAEVAIPVREFVSETDKNAE